MEDTSLLENRIWPPEIKNHLQLPHVKGVVIGLEGNDVVLKTPWMRWQMILSWVVVVVTECVKLYVLWKLLDQLPLGARHTTQFISLQGKVINGTIATIAFIPLMGIIFCLMYTFRFHKGRYILDSDARSLISGTGYIVPYSDITDIQYRRIMLSNKYEIVINYWKQRKGNAKVRKFVMHVPLNKDNALIVTDFMTKTIRRELEVALN